MLNSLLIYRRYYTTYALFRFEGWEGKTAIARTDAEFAWRKHCIIPPISIGRAAFIPLLGQDRPKIGRFTFVLNININVDDFVQWPRFLSAPTRLLRVKFSSCALNDRLSDTLIDQRLIAARPQCRKIYMLIVIVFQNVFQPRVEYSFVSNLLLMSTIPFARARVCVSLNEIRFQ
jgi:hypothetical protein